MEARRLQLDSELGLGLQRVSAGVDVSDRYLPRRRTQEPFDGAQGAGLPGTVGTEESIDLPLADVEVDAVNGDGRPVGDP